MGGDGMKGPQIPPLWEHRKCKNNHQAVGFSHLESPQDTETIHNTRQNRPSAPGPTEIQALIKTLEKVFTTELLVCLCCQ